MPRRCSQPQAGPQEVREQAAHHPSALEHVPAGSWTAYEDLAELVGGSPDEIAHLLAETYVENSHRVLQANGQVPLAAHQHFRYRGGDLRERLVEEGVEFEGRHASQEQWVTADLLRERVAEAASPEVAAQRAWLVRGGANVDGVDLVPAWLDQCWVSAPLDDCRELDSDPWFVP